MYGVREGERKRKEREREGGRGRERVTERESFIMMYAYYVNSIAYDYTYFFRACQR